jgi:hypothetical protein
MVSIKEEKLLKVETNLRYLIELDLRLEETTNNPLVMAFYYNYLEKNSLQNINKTTLISWARNYCYETIVNKKFSKKKDIEITAATLTYATLKKDQGYKEEKKQKIEEEIKPLLKKELTKNKLFFNGPNFTAVILWAANEAGIEIDNEYEIVEALIKRYADLRNMNNLLGLPFLTGLLLDLGKTKEVKGMIEKAEGKLKDKLLEYDDKLYIAESLWIYHEKTNKENLISIQGMAESVIDSTPIILADVINKGDISDITVKEDNRKISMIYKAVFLDLIERYKNYSTYLEEKKLDRRYAGESGLKWGGFTLYSLVSLIPATAWTWALWEKEMLTLKFWFLQNPDIGKLDLIAGTGTIVISLYLATFGVTAIYSFYISIIRQKLVKNLRIFEKLIATQKRVGKKFLKYFALTLAGGVVLQIIATALQSFITKA